MTAHAEICPICKGKRVIDNSPDLYASRCRGCDGKGWVTIGDDNFPGHTINDLANQIGDLDEARERLRANIWGQYGGSKIKNELMKRHNMECNIMIDNRRHVMGFNKEEI